MARCANLVLHCLVSWEGTPAAFHAVAAATSPFVRKLYEYGDVIMKPTYPS